MEAYIKTPRKRGSDIASSDDVTGIHVPIQPQSHIQTASVKGTKQDTTLKLMSIVSLKHILKHHVEEESKLPQATTLGQYSFPVCGKSVRVVSIRNQLELMERKLRVIHGLQEVSHERKIPGSFVAIDRRYTTRRANLWIFKIKSRLFSRFHTGRDELLEPNLISQSF
jgi:hypothetical protein